MARISLVSAVLVVVLLVGCAPSGNSSGAGGAGSGPAPEARPQRLLTVMDKSEPPALTNVATGGVGTVATSFFSANLTWVDAQGIHQPLLAESLPRLDTDSWRVFPDGQMETVHKLRPNLTWHDGTPLDAQDFVFGHKVTMSKGQSLFAPSILERAVGEVVATDSRTILIRWPAPYADPELGVRPLPRHLLEQQFETSPPDVFANLPYWTVQYVGLGAYRLSDWTPGSHVEGVAFDGHALGRPKIDKIRIIWSGDANAVVANVLAGAVDFAAENSLQFEQGVELDRRWDQGKVLYWPDSIRYLQVQFKPDYVNPRALLDVRVRRALMHSLDRQALVDGLLDGKSQIADTLFSPDLAFYPEVDRVIPKYPYDLRRADELMGQAGFTKPAGGLYTSATGEPFKLPILGDDAKELTLLVDSWKRAGVEIDRQDLPPALFADVEVRSVFPGLAVQFNNVTESTTLNKYVTSSIAQPPRWAGFNRGGYSNPEFDRLSELYYQTLDRSARNGYLIQSMKILLDDNIAFPMFYRQRALGYTKSLAFPFERFTFGSNLKTWEWAWR
jgi:peptide/nickel transport system substrate-binding protein